MNKYSTDSSHASTSIPEKGQLTLVGLKKCVRTGMKVPPANLPDDEIALLFEFLDEKCAGSVQVAHIADFLMSQSGEKGIDHRKSGAAGDRGSPFQRGENGSVGRFRELGTSI